MCDMRPYEYQALSPPHSALINPATLTCTHMFIMAQVVSITLYAARIHREIECVAHQKLRPNTVLVEFGS